MTFVPGHFIDHLGVTRPGQERQVHVPGRMYGIVHDRRPLLPGEPDHAALSRRRLALAPSNTALCQSSLRRPHMTVSSTHLPSLLANDAHGPHSPLLVVSSSAHSLSPLPVVAHYLARPQPVVLVSALHEPRKLGWLAGREGAVVDLRSWIEGFDGGERDSWGVAELEANIWSAVQTCAVSFQPFSRPPMP